jgi:hypothetical protein
MFSTDIYLSQPVYTQRDPKAALKAFSRVRWQAELARRWAAFTGRSTSLRALPPVAGSQHFAGTRTVPVSQVLGSESRTRDFDRDFNPLDDKSRDRWVSIFRAWQRGRDLPPVELIEVNGAYYVRDGHHRLSVARALGQEYVEAVVTRWG